MTSEKAAGSAWPQDQAAVPLVASDVLERLGQSLDSAAMAARFAKDYIGLWERRLRRLEAALGRSDFPAAIDAVISLRTASVMVGALRLADLAQQVENAVNGGDFAAGRELMAAVGACGAETVEELALVSLGPGI